MRAWYSDSDATAVVATAYTAIEVGLNGTGAEALPEHGELGRIEVELDTLDTVPDPLNVTVYLSHDSAGLELITPPAEQEATLRTATGGGVAWSLDETPWRLRDSLYVHVWLDKGGAETCTGNATVRIYGFTDGPYRG